MNTLCYFVEGEIYDKSCVPKSFIEKEYFKEIPKETDKCVLKVCGIVSIDPKDYIFFPKAYNINQDDKKLRNTGGVLFQALLKYKDSVRLLDEESDWLGNKNNDIKHLNLIQWLLNDYIQNGLYKVSERLVEENGKGRIEWTRTIKTKLPFIIGNQFSYLNLVTSKNNITSDHIISNIHEKIILECIRDFGWLFGLNDTGKFIDVNIDKSQQIVVLKKKLKETFTGREIRLLQQLIAYIEKSFGEKSDFVMVTPYFYAIWEEMLKCQLGHDERLSNLMAKPYWKIGDEKSYTRQIPDILIENNRDLIILDAKYYSTIDNIPMFEDEDIKREKLPGWGSVVKQLYYNLSLKDKGYENIKNIFLLPKSLENEEFEYIGYTSVDGKEEEFSYVLAFWMDIDVVLQDYVRSRNRNKDLFEAIVSSTN